MVARTIDCSICGKPFETNAAHATMCGSVECKREYNTRWKRAQAEWKKLATTIETRPCAICGQPFEPYQNRKNQVVCRNKECVAQNKRNRANEITKGRPHKGDNPCVCVVCESPFLGHHNSLVCSRTCRLARTNELNRRRHGSKQPECLVCGKLLPWQGGTFFTCPGECRSIARKRRTRRAYVKNPERRERMVDAFRRRKREDPAFAKRMAENDRERLRRGNANALSLQFTILASKLGNKKEDIDGDDSRDKPEV